MSANLTVFTAPTELDLNDDGKRRGKERLPETLRGSDERKSRSSLAESWISRITLPLLDFPFGEPLDNERDDFLLFDGEELEERDLIPELDFLDPLDLTDDADDFLDDFVGVSE